MALVITDHCSNWMIDIFNTAGGESARSSIAIGLHLDIYLTQTDVDNLSNVFRDRLKTIWDNQWAVGPVHVIENNDGTLKVWDNATPEVGTASAAAYGTPAQAVVVSKSTGLSGRAFRGRFFLPGVVSTEVNEAGSLSAGRFAALQTIMDDLHDDLTGLTPVLEVVLFHDESSPGDHTPTQITSFLVRQIIGTMRPRQRR